MTYVYPVVSRRAGGVSDGVNLNPNHACNWACVYCQVPDLVRGSAPEIDLAQLEAELRALLGDILHGDFMQTRVPEGAQRLNVIALSVNGEPTSAPMTYPTPPIGDAPPMTQAAITSNSMPSPALGVELFKRAATIKPAREARTPILINV